MIKKLFRIGKDDFPIKIDYRQDIWEIHGKVVARVKTWGDLNLNKCSYLYHGQKKIFVCYYAELLEDSDLREKEKIFLDHRIVPADIKQFLTFGVYYLVKGVTPGCAPIVAAAKGSTWKCSDKCLDEFPCLYWSDWPQSPGPGLDTIFAPLKAGTRILAIRQ